VQTADSGRYLLTIASTKTTTKKHMIWKSALHIVMPFTAVLLAERYSSNSNGWDCWMWQTVHHGPLQYDVRSLWGYNVKWSPRSQIRHGSCHTWHIDGYDKLRPYDIRISGYGTHPVSCLLIWNQNVFSNIRNESHCQLHCNNGTFARATYRPKSAYNFWYGVPGLTGSIKALSKTNTITLY